MPTGDLDWTARDKRGHIDTLDTHLLALAYKDVERLKRRCANLQRQLNDAGIVEHIPWQER